MKLQFLKINNNTNNVVYCVLFQGCAQVSLADFSPENVSVKWYNILSFRFMQPPSDMTGTNSDALPPHPQLWVGNADIRKETQSTVSCQDEERSNNNQGSEVSFFNKQVASLKEESSDDSTVISSQTSTLTRNQGTFIWSTVGYKFQALEILPFAVFNLAGYLVHSV
jgi:protein KIBRA